MCIFFHIGPLLQYAAAMHWSFEFDTYSVFTRQSQLRCDRCTWSQSSPATYLCRPRVAFQCPSRPANQAGRGKLPQTPHKGPAGTPLGVLYGKNPPQSVSPMACPLGSSERVSHFRRYKGSLGRLMVSSSVGLAVGAPKRPWLSRTRCTPGACSNASMTGNFQMDAACWASGSAGCSTIPEPPVQTT